MSALKVRVKFAKDGAMKFIGHLDIMRYFQKAIRRAQIPIAFSGGFSPHMIMSFAAPLGVGVTSSGEYFDMELKEEMTSKEMEDRLNAAMVDGMKVISVRQIPDSKASACMSLVAAADYLVNFREGKEPVDDWKEKLEAFFSQESMVIMRKTKRSEQETDIKPWIYKWELRGDAVWMQLSQGSVHNLKPELVMEAFAKYLGVELQPFALMVHREEVYADLGTETKHKLVSLEDLGTEIK
ncbi:MAG: TIGR03936 family radical SAM-associated protein [Ruminococcus sp.]|nr:TIGR03936 family radical SAM-associated protein [Ruminococcus sp.]